MPLESTQTLGWQLTPVGDAGSFVHGWHGSGQSGPSEAAVREALTTLAIADREPVSQTYVSMVVETGTADQALPIVLRFGP